MCCAVIFGAAEPSCACAVPHCSPFVLSHIVSRSVVLCCAALCSAVLNRAVSCCS